MNYWLLILIVTPLTMGIAGLVWQHKLCDRIGNELRRRGIDYSFSAASFWLWCILGTIIIVGPIIFLHKQFAAVNKLNADFNMKG